jgi:ABC-type sugar transport system substrate-binding protein
VRQLAALVAAVVVPLSVAACGGSDTTSSGGSATAPAGGSSHAAKLGSGTVGIITANSQSEVLTHWAKTAQTALGDVGWKGVIADGKGDPSVWSQAISNFTNQRVDGIITLAIDPAPVVPQLQAAKSAGIPVIASGISVAGKTDLFAARYAPQDQEFGRVLAAYLKQRMPAGSEYIALDMSAVSGAHALVTASTPLLNGDGFKLAGTHDMNPADLVNQAAKGTADLIQANPKARFLLSCCDFTPPINVAALKQVGKTNVVTASRYDNLSTLKLIRDGAPVVIAAANADTGILTAVDQIIAKKAKKAQIDPAADRGKYQFKVIDRKNVPAAGRYLFDPAEQIAAFVRKWKLEYAS